MQHLLVIDLLGAEPSYGDGEREREREREKERERCKEQVIENERRTSKTEKHK